MTKSLRFRWEIEVFGINVRKNPCLIKSKIGVMPQEDNLDSESWSSLFRQPPKDFKWFAAHGHTASFAFGRVSQ